MMLPFFGGVGSTGSGWWHTVGTRETVYSPHAVTPSAQDNGGGRSCSFDFPLVVDHSLPLHVFFGSTQLFKCGQVFHFFFLRECECGWRWGGSPFRLNKSPPRSSDRWMPISTEAWLEQQTYIYIYRRRTARPFIYFLFFLFFDYITSLLTF